MFSCLIWLKVVEPSVRIGDRMEEFEMTWMRKMSARRARQSERNARKMRFSPFWLKIRIPESMAAGSGAKCGFATWWVKVRESRGRGEARR